MNMDMDMDDLTRDDEIPIDPESDLTPEQQRAIVLLARGTPVQETARRCKISQRQLWNWRNTNRQFISALNIAQIEAASRVRGQMDVLADLAFRRLVEDLSERGALDEYKPADRVKLVGILAKYASDMSPKLSVSETRTTTEPDEWPTAPADDGSSQQPPPVPAQVTYDDDA